MIIAILCVYSIGGHFQPRSSTFSSTTESLLSLHLTILLDVNVVIRLQHADLVIGNFNTVQTVRYDESSWQMLYEREALDQSELMFDISAIALCLLLCFVQLIRRGVFFQRDLEPLSARIFSHEGG